MSATDFSAPYLQSVTFAETPKLAGDDWIVPVVVAGFGTGWPTMAETAFGLTFAQTEEASSATAGGRASRVEAACAPLDVATSKATLVPPIIRPTLTTSAPADWKTIRRVRVAIIGHPLDASER
jgi:hypothetical protein